MAHYGTHIISLASKWTASIQAQETLALLFYNQVNYLLRQNFFYHHEQPCDESTLKFDHKYPTFATVYATIKTFEHYKILPSQVAQNVVKEVLQQFNAYRGLVKAKYSKF